MQTSILIVFILYMLATITVGYVFYRKKMNLNQYILGDRKLNPWVTAMSAQASDMSGWLLTGVPGLVYAGILGISGKTIDDAKAAIWTAIGLAIGTALNWLIIAKRLRVYTEVSGNSLTIPSYLENRFKDKKGIIAIITAVVLLVFFTVYTSSMFSAGAKLFSNIFGLDYTLALLIGAIVIVGYTFLGGFLAVSWTDLIQGILMFFCLVFVPLFMLGNFSGEETNAVSNVLSGLIQLFPSNDPSVSYGLLGILSGLGWGLGYFGMPHILARFMACKDQKTIKPATIIALVWVVITLVAAVLIGVFGSVYLGPILADGEQVFMEVVKKLFHPVVAGIMLSAILAAIMSTADSQLLVASTAFSADIFRRLYKKIFKKEASEKLLLLTSKLALLAIAIVAFLLALDPNSSVFEIVSYAWAGLGASFGPIILLSLYNKKVTSKGAIAGIVTGALVTILFKYVLAQFGGFWAIYEIIPGFILSTAAILIASRFDKPTQDMLDEFDEMKRQIAEGKNKKDKTEVINDKAVADGVCAESATKEVVSDAAAEE